MPRPYIDFMSVPVNRPTAIDSYEESDERALRMASSKGTFQNCRGGAPSLPQEFRILKFRSAIWRAIVRRLLGASAGESNCTIPLGGHAYLWTVISREEEMFEMFVQDMTPVFRMLSCRQPLLRTSKASGSSQTTWVPASRMPPSTISIDARPTHRVGRQTLHVQASRRHDDGRVQ